MFFRKRRDSFWDILKDNQVLSEFEFHVYKLLKFVLRPVIGAHKQDYLNGMFDLKDTRETRQQKTQVVFEQLARRKIERNYIKYVQLDFLKYSAEIKSSLIISHLSICAS